MTYNGAVKDCAFADTGFAQSFAKLPNHYVGLIRSSSDCQPFPG